MGISGNYWSQGYSFIRSDSIPVYHTTPLQNAWNGGLNTTQISKIDLNNDALMDLFVFDRAGNKVNTYINQGSVGVADYKHDPSYESQFPGELQNWVLLRDFDGDGLKDIFGHTVGGIKVWKNISTPGNLQFSIETPLIYSDYPLLALNLYVSSVDVPSVTDIDNDGDLDVLTFDQFGDYLEYHRNLSQETYGHSDSLIFELRNHCWGHFMESMGSSTISLYDTCDNSDLTVVEMPTGATPKLHSGSTVLALDLNGSGVMDLLLGDIMSNTIAMLRNSGTTVNSNSSMDSIDMTFPSYDMPANIQIFPASFYEDIDNDGIRDLVVTSNTTAISEDNTSIHYFLNTNTDDSPIFSFQQNNFLQDGMIDLGTGGIPTFFDHNADGLMDLVVSNYGTLNKLTGLHEPTAWLYENQGTVTDPAFHLITKKYMNLNVAGTAKNMVLTFGDLDGDGDEDMMIGDFDGVLHYFTNTAGAGATASFVLTQPNYQDGSGSVIDVGLSAAPYFIDLDDDLDLDLIVGEGNGNINYYENTGSSVSPSYSLLTDTLGGIQSIFNGGKIQNSIPRFFENTAGETQMFVGTSNGEIIHYDSIDGNLNGDFALLDSIVTGTNEGPSTAPTAYDINGDGKIDLIFGTERGGVIYYKGNGLLTGVRDGELPTYRLIIYPNPANETVQLQFDKMVIGNYMMFGVSGKLVAEGSISGYRKTIDLNNLDSGLYLVVVEVGGVRNVQRLIVN